MLRLAPLLLLLLAGLGGCLQDPQSDVAVASYPVAFIAQRLVEGTNLSLVHLGNPNVSLHAFEPSAQDLRVMRGTQLIMLHGLGLEQWAILALDSIGAEMFVVKDSPAPPLGHCHGPCPPPPPPSPEPIPAGVSAVFIASLPGREKYLAPDHVHEVDGSVTRGQGLVDAHTWLDPLAYLAESRRAAAALAQRFPEWEGVIQSNAANLSADLSDLHEAYKAALTDCDQEIIATNHNAYAYLARRYGFTVVALHAIEPGAQPDPESVRRVIQAIRDLDLRSFFIEENTDPAVVDAVRRETGVRIQTLHALELQPRGGHDYLSRAYENLESLKDALECR